jgi:hypothetical protein
MSQHPEAKEIAAVNRACWDVTYEQVESTIYFDQPPLPEDVPINKQVSSIIVQIL